LRGARWQTFWRSIKDLLSQDGVYPQRIPSAYRQGTNRVPCIPYLGRRFIAPSPEKLHVVSQVQSQHRPTRADRPMSAPEKVVFLIDVDNTLLDNDHVQADLRAELVRTLGEQQCKQYWEILEALRKELGYVDYLGSLQRLRKNGVNDAQLVKMSSFLLDYPFPERVYDGAFKTLQHLNQWGPTVILSDGDVVFQPRKIRRSGLWEAVQDRVLIYVHKEAVLAQVEQIYPATHYVMIDDKLHILDAMKAVWGDRLTTIFVRQGHYALDDKANSALAAADMQFDRIGQLLEYRPAY
jgi:FMN phosphatase YigB (HAD superfamily)